MKKYDIAIFDLDGTLLDTLDDLASALNRTLASLGYPARTQEQVRQAVGNGVARLVRDSIPGAEEEAVRSATEAFRADYAAHADVETKPYAGIEEMLTRLRVAGIPAVVNSNKFSAASEALIRSHFPGKIEMVVGETEGMPKKPHPAGVFRILDTFGIDAQDAVYIGDSAVDAATAKNAGVDFAFVEWGFRTPEEMPEDAKKRAFSDAGALGDWILGQAK